MSVSTAIQDAFRAVLNARSEAKALRVLEDVRNRLVAARAAHWNGPDEPTLDDVPALVAELVNDRDDYRELAKECRAYGDEQASQHARALKLLESHAAGVSAEVADVIKDVIAILQGLD